MLPPVDPTTGFLPLGAHPATLDDLYFAFVQNAPDMPRRHLIFDALSVYLSTVKTFFPSGLALVDGGFTTHKADVPHDVDVVLLPDDPSVASYWTEKQWMDWQGLVTLQDVIIGGQDAAYYQRVQPFGGLLDGFLAAPEREQQWREFWATIRGKDNQPIPNSKGYLEVRW
jgi:hypothetical protein